MISASLSLTSKHCSNLAKSFNVRIDEEATTLPLLVLVLLSFE